MLGTLLALPLFLANPAIVVAGSLHPGAAQGWAAPETSPGTPGPMALESSPPTSTPVLRRTASAVGNRSCEIGRPLPSDDRTTVDPDREPRSGHVLLTPGRGPPRPLASPVGGRTDR